MTQKSDDTNTRERKRKITAPPGEDIREHLQKTNRALYIKIATIQESEMKYLNGRIAQVKRGDKVRYIDNHDDELVFYSDKDMAQILGDRRVLTWNQEWAPAFKWWQAQADRKQYRRVVFEPNPRKVRDGDLNEFQGWAVSPNSKAGSCEKFKQHLKDNVCAGDAASYTYLRKWMASIFKNPGDKIGVALVLYSSEKGTGKSIVGEYLAYMIGERYCPGVSTPEGLTGKHNSHLGKALLVRVEEALHAKDPRHDSQLKHLVTASRAMIEPKGVDAQERESKANFIFTSNREQVVPATSGERRFFVLRVAANKVQDRQYFKAIIEERNKGGAEAFMAELMAEDLTGFDTMTPPATVALGDQINEGLTGLDAWWRDVLAEGRLPWRGEGADGAPCELGWPETDPWTVQCAVVQQSAADHVRSYHGPPSPASVGRFIAKMTGAEKQRESSGGRAWCYVLPSLDDCRVAFVKAHKGLTLKHVGGAQTAPMVTDAAQGSGDGGGNVVALKPPGRVKRFG